MTVYNAADDRANDQPDTTADGNDEPDTADTMDASADDPADDQPDTADMMDASADDPADDQPDTTDAMDAEVFEIITQTDSGLTALHTEQIPSDLDSGLTALHTEQIPSETADSDSPPESSSIPDEARVPDARPQAPVVIDDFPFGSPGAPIDGMHGSSAYESRQESLGGSVWAPFQSECDWRVAHWAKANGITSSAITDLLAIPDVRTPFSFSLLRC
jgi:hypothetical protein